MEIMKIVNQGGWVYYLGEDYKTLDKQKSGKWMYFFDNNEFVARICQKAVEENIVVESKHSDNESGVACFYLNGDDLVRHKKTIRFFLENGLIKRTKTGKLHNISFKFNEQTRAREYGVNFKAEIKLEQFVDLSTGKWIEA